MSIPRRETLNDKGEACIGITDVESKGKRLALDLGIWIREFFCTWRMNNPFRLWFGRPAPLSAGHLEWKTLHLLSLTHHQQDLTKYLYTSTEKDWNLLMMKDTRLATKVWKRFDSFCMNVTYHSHAIRPESNIIDSRFQFFLQHLVQENG